MKNYINWRKEEFGNLEDMTLTRGSKLHFLLKDGVIRLLQETTAEGCAVIVIRLKKINVKVHNPTNIMQMFHFFVMVGFLLIYLIFYF